MHTSHYPKKLILSYAQAALLLLSLRSNFHTEYYGRRGGKTLIRETCFLFKQILHVFNTKIDSICVHYLLWSGLGQHRRSKGAKTFDLPCHLDKSHPREQDWHIQKNHYMVVWINSPLSCNFHQSVYVRRCKYPHSSLGRSEKIKVMKNIILQFRKVRQEKVTKGLGGVMHVCKKLSSNTLI